MQAGEILANKYRLIKRLGEGGEGSVFLAIHIQTEIFWAVKEIHIDQGEENTHFCHELQMMKSLRNRHLPQIIDVISQGECVYLVMEHVRGIPMDKKVSEGRTLHADEVWDTAMQVAEVLCYLESRETPVCHLDIKPSNLILRPDGLIKLVDFGSAWKEKTQVRRMVTDGYAAPEQYLEDGSEPDARTDIYGLGATLYRLISGRKWSPDQSSDEIPNCPRELSDLILTCLQADPEDRFQSASVLMDSLENINRRQRWTKGRIQLLGALAMVFPAMALCLRILPSTIDLSADESWNYDKLVREASVVSEEDSRTYYRKAIFMDPGRSDAYLQYLTDAQIDGTMSDEEEIFLRDTLHTVRPGSDLTYEELLSQDPYAYARTTLQIALAYWYSFPRDDGRRIALGWFQKAVKAAGSVGEKVPEEERPAEESAGKRTQAVLETDMKRIREEADLYLQLGTILEKIHSPDEEQVALSTPEYWKSLESIVAEISEPKEMNEPLTQLKMIRDALGTITFLSGDLERAGINCEEQTEMIRKMDALACSIKIPKEQAEIGRSIREEINISLKNALRAAGNLEGVKETEEET